MRTALNKQSVPHAPEKHWKISGAVFLWTIGLAILLQPVKASPPPLVLAAAPVVTDPTDTLDLESAEFPGFKVKSGVAVDAWHLTGKFSDSAAVPFPGVADVRSQVPMAIAQATETIPTANQAATSFVPVSPAPLTAQTITAADRQPAWGDTGQTYWYVQGGGAISFDPDDDGTAVFGMGGVGVTQFFANGHSASAELNTLGFLQPGTDALGVNLNVLLRWHFIRQPNWSLYIDGGAGILLATSDVPSAGSQFNFTPQAGAGATFRVREEQRLMVGLRWHHISNGDIFAANPGRDSVLGYVGLTLP